MDACSGSQSNSLQTGLEGPGRQPHWLGTRRPSCSLARPLTADDDDDGDGDSDDGGDGDDDGDNNEETDQEGLGAWAARVLSSMCLLFLQ